MAFSPTALTFCEAADVLQAGLQAISAGETEIDLQHLQRFDSSAVAALLAWHRQAVAQGAPLRVANLPQGLESLARVYGVASLLHH
jgi:phospholipid transport system transporter-binding protein